MAETPPIAEPAHTRYGLGDHVLVARDPGVAPAEAVIVGINDARPHLVKVKYLHLRSGAWIARARILGPTTSSAPRPLDDRGLNHV